MYTADIIATGPDSEYPEDPSAVDAEISFLGDLIGEVTLRQIDGELSTWGDIDHWADPRVRGWLANTPEGMAKHETIDGIVAAVRVALEESLSE